MEVEEGNQIPYDYLNGVYSYLFKPRCIPSTTNHHHHLPPFPKIYCIKSTTDTASFTDMYYRVRWALMNTGDWISWV